MSKKLAHADGVSRCPPISVTPYNLALSGALFLSRVRSPSVRSHHLVHYKKEGIVLIIRKILTELPHDLPEVSTFTNANPVKRI